MYIAMKDFPFSRNGVTVEYATKGNPVDVPANLVPGLIEARMIAETGKHEVKATAPAENKMQAVVENKDDDTELEAVRDRYQEAVGKRPYWGWSIDELEAKIAEANDGPEDKANDEAE